MGHYDDSYEYDRKKYSDEQIKYHRNEIIKFLKTAQEKDLKLVHDFIENLDDWKGFFKVIKSVDND